MSLRELRVEGLFDEFNHKIVFRVNDGLTILGGPNGVGKTTLLRVLDNLFNKKFSALRRMPLNAVQVKFAGGDDLQVTRRPGTTEKSKNSHTLEFILHPAEGHSHTWTMPAENQIDIPAGMIDDIIPELTRVAPHQWRNDLTGQILNLDDVIDSYDDRLAPVLTPRSGRTATPEWLSSLLARVPVYFIQADRLSSMSTSRSRPRLGREYTQATPTVLIYAEDLSEKIKKAKADYGDFSQTLDSTFPARLLQKKPPAQVPSDQAIRERYNEQAARRTRYVKAGLLDSGDELRLPDRKLEDAELRVLDAYLTDVDDKLLQLDNIADKLELFLQIVNSKFRRKAILIDRQKGIRAVTMPKEEDLALASLSSGEQQELVLAYGLLFREDPGTLILLDEPELSLHVTWQIDLIPDLLRISELSQLKFLIATHSPQVINDRWDLTVELSDDVG
jgi:predicted ATP-binding protein involved in virulence